MLNLSDLSNYKTKKIIIRNMTNSRLSIGDLKIVLEVNGTFNLLAQNSFNKRSIRSIDDICNSRDLEIAVVTGKIKMYDENMVELTTAEAINATDEGTGGSSLNLISDTLNDKRNILLTVGGGSPSSTGGCSTPTQIQSTTYYNNTYCADFSNSGTPAMEWDFILPNDFNTSGQVKFQYIYLTKASGTGAVEMELSLYCLGNGDSIDFSPEYTSSIVSSQSHSANCLYLSSQTNITIQNSPTANKICFAKIRRKNTVSGNLAASISLREVYLEYEVSVS